MAKFKGSKFKGGNITPPPKPEPCVACDGSGHYDTNGSPPCAACDGTGIEPPKEQL